MRDIKITKTTEGMPTTETLFSPEDVVSINHPESPITETIDQNDKRLKLDEESEHFNLTIKPMWKKEAQNVQTIADASDFAFSMFKLYTHDYGTIVHACHYVMVAAINGFNRSGPMVASLNEFNRSSPSSSITCFQSSCLGHMMFKHFAPHTAEYYKKLFELDGVRKEIFDPYNIKMSELVEKPNVTANIIAETIKGKLVKEMTGENNE